MLRPRLAALVSVVFLAGCHASSDDAPGLGVSDDTQKPPTAQTKGAKDQKGSTDPDQTDPGDSTPPADDGTVSPKFVDYAVNHILVTGQSNSVANGGTPYLSKSQPYGNLMFDTGVMPAGNCDGDGCYKYQTPSSFKPLVEGDTFFDYQVETSGSGMANQISNLATTRFGMPKHDVLVSVHGRSGNTYWCLRKGSCNYHPANMVKPFDQAMMEVASAKAIADAQGLTYGVRAAAAIHGESDHYGYSFGTPEFPLDGTDGTPGKIKDYSDALVEWQEDYENGVKAITGQTTPVPLFISQLSGWNDMTFSKIAQMQLDAHLKAPGKVVLIGGTYHLSIASDCLHFDAAGERRLGEYFAKAYARQVINGTPWEPLRPLTVTRAGNVLTVKFLVPKAPLVLDTDSISNPGNYGFTFVDGSGTSIAGVELAGADTVKITLSKEPSAGAALRYAQNQIPQTCTGIAGGARGNLRDSDDTASQTGGDPLYNWSVAFQMPVN